MRVVGFFCDDIRQEIGSKDTLVGVLKDIFFVPSVPGMMAKVGVYVRILFDPRNPPTTISSSIEIPWGNAMPLGSATSDLINKSVQQALENDLPHAGIILRGLFSPFPILGEGLVKAVVRIDDAEPVIGALLKIKLKPPTGSSPAASPPPSKS